MVNIQYHETTPEVNNSDIQIETSNTATPTFGNSSPLVIGIMILAAYFIFK